MRRGPNHRLERLARPPEPAAKLGDLERACAGFPDQDLEACPRLRVLRERDVAAVAEERRARERVQHGPLDDPCAGDDDDAFMESWAHGRLREEVRDRNVTPRGAGSRPRQQAVARRLVEEAIKRSDLLAAHQMRQSATEVFHMRKCVVGEGRKARLRSAATRVPEAPEHRRELGL